MVSTLISGRKMWLKISLFFLILAPTDLAAQHWKYPTELDAKMERILNFKNVNENVTAVPNISKVLLPIELLPTSVEIMLDVLLINSPENLKKAAQTNSILLEKVETFKNKSAEWGYVKTRLMLNKTVLHALQGEYISTLWAFYQTFSQLSGTMDKHPEFPPLHTLASLFNKGLAATREYDSKLKYLLPNPIAVNPELLKHEWSTVDKPLFESFNIIFEKEPQVPAKWTIKPKTQSEKLVYAVYFLNMRFSPKALEILESVEGTMSPIDNFLHGWANLTLGDYNKALSFFEAHLKQPKPVILKRASILGLYYVNVIEEKKLPATSFIEKSEKYAESNAYRDRVAKRELEMEHHPKLLQARLLFDGHKFAEAEKILQSLNDATLKDDFKLEYFYRRGRIRYQLKDYAAALTEFQKCLDPTLPEKSYYKAQAAFDSGEIFKRNKNTEQAQKQYNLSIQYAKNARRGDIESKARNALKELKQ
jgi:tetratricopeptide (TPR) repeat protein